MIKIIKILKNFLKIKIKNDKNNKNFRQILFWSDFVSHVFEFFLFELLKRFLFESWTLFEV